MVKTIYFGDFTEEFARMGRKDQFSYDGLRAIFDHLEIINPNYDLDVVELCCDYTEYDKNELKDQYGYLVDEDAELDQLLYELESRTIVIRTNDTFIVAEF